MMTEVVTRVVEDGSVDPRISLLNLAEMRGVPVQLGMEFNMGHFSPPPDHPSDPSPSRVDWRGTVVRIEGDQVFVAVTKAGDEGPFATIEVGLHDPIAY